MSKFVSSVQSYLNCFGWVVAVIWEALLENNPDLKFWDPPTNFEDFLWYAERVNGRLAMLALTVILSWKCTDLLFVTNHVQ